MKRLIIKYLSIMLSLSLLLSIISGCKSKTNDFPELSYPSASSEESSLNNDSGDDFIDVSLTELNVALPYSEGTINLLLNLYYAKTNNLLPDGVTGADVDISFLESIECPWIVNSIMTTSDGASISSVNGWQSNGRMPDLFLANDLEGLNSNGVITPLNNYVADNSYLSANSINSNAVTSSINAGEFLGVPHYMSIMLIAGNCDYAPSENVLPFRPTLNEFSQYMDLIALENNSSDSDNSVVVFSKAYELFPYLSSAFNNDVPSSFIFADEYAEDSASLDAAISYVESIYSNDLSDSQDSVSDARFSRNAALWLISSSEVSMWANYYLDNLYYSLIPCSDSQNDAVFYTTYYYLCVSQTCTNKEFAANFATFISFDPDALELIWRLEQHSGYFPVINNDAVWDIVSGDPYFGTETMVVRQYLNNSVICPSSSSSVYQNVNSYCSYYFDVSRNETLEFDVQEAFND